jgi:hypothetical protein
MRWPSRSLQNGEGVRGKPNFALEPAKNVPAPALAIQIVLGFDLGVQDMFELVVG